MKGTIDRYIDKVMGVADIRNADREAAIRAELHDHLHEKVKELQATGYGEAEALVKAVEDHGSPLYIGYSLREWRFLDVRLRGTARGVIAIGPRAVGGLAIGGVAVGVVACGGIAVGAFSMGGLALALLASFGGVSIGGLSFGGLAVGLIALGGFAFGGIATGGTAGGLWVPGAGTLVGSYFSEATLPSWIRAVASFISFDLSSPAGATSYTRMMLIVNLLTLPPMMMLLILQGVLSRRETKRVRAIAGPTLE